VRAAHSAIVRENSVHSDRPWIHVKWPGCSSRTHIELSTVQYIAPIHTAPRRRWKRLPLRGVRSTTSPTASENVAPIACRAIRRFQCRIPDSL
jgi:hypothetical protein